MTDWSVALQVGGTIVAAVIAAVVTWLTTKIQHKGKAENAIIDQLQQNVEAQGADIAALKEEMQGLKRRELRLMDYTNELRMHINNELGPPPPPWPDGLYQ